MGEFLAEARVLVVPDTTKFRAALVAQLAAATKGVTVPVNIIPSVGGTAATTGFARLTEVQNQLRREALLTAGALDQQSKAATRASHTIGDVRKGAIASLASLTGLRGAVLAASGGFLAAAVGATALIKSLQEFAQLETTLNVFAATTEATGDEMERVSNLARELGADLSLPAVSATDAATAMLELSKAGLSVEDAMGGARGVLQLATAAQITTAEAAQFAANELNAFGLAGDQAVRVADVLANSAQAAQGSISDFGLAFKQSAAVANLVGLSLEDTAAQLTILARAGLQGSDAGTSLRVALLRLINPTKAARDVIEQLGIEIRDVNGNLRPDVLVQFGEATRRMAPAMRDAAFATVFGADALRTVSIAAEAGRDALVEATVAISEVGTAQEQAEARTAGFGGQLEALQSSAATTAVSLGEISTILAGPFVFGLTQAATFLNRVLEPMAELVRLSKQKLGLNFDPSTASAAELLAKVNELQEEISQAPAFQQEALFGKFLQNAVKDTIRALEGQRAVQQALGLDTAALTALIKDLQDQLVATGSTAVSGLSPLEEQIQKTRDLLEALPAGVDPGPLRKSLQEMEDEVALLAQEGGRFAERFDRAFRNAAGGVDVLTAALQRLRGEVAASSDALLKAQNEGASPQTQIAILQGQRQTQEDIIATLKQGGIVAGEPSQIRAAREEINRIQSQIDSLQQGIVSDAEAAAREAENAAKKAQDARDKQFQAIASMFGERQEDIENAIERAGIAGNVEAQIRLNKALIRSLQKERDVLLERLRTLKVSTDVIKKIMELINDEIEDAQQNILRLQKEQQENLADFATPEIDLRIRIAQARDNVAQEIALRRQRLTLITKELVKLKNAGKKNTLAWLELKAQQAEEIAAINDLAAQTKDEGNRAAEFFFEQLQAQQGFAANLLGNLIPAGQTAGLVGIPSPTPPPTIGTTGVGAGVAAAAAVQAGKQQGNPTAGQANTTNALLQRILQALIDLNRNADTPEAVNNKRAGSAVMDGVGGGSSTGAGGYGY